MPRKKSSRRRRSYSSRSSLGTALRRPIVQISILVVVAIVIFLIASMGGEQSSNTDMLPASVSVDEAHQMYTDAGCAHTRRVERIPCAEHHFDPP